MAATRCSRAAAVIVSAADNNSRSCAASWSEGGPPSPTRAGQCPLAAPYGRPGHSPPGASVRIWRRRNLCSSAWNRWRTQGMPEGQASLSGHTAVDLAGSGLRSDHHGPLCQDALADAERAFGVCAGPSAPRHHHFAHPGWVPYEHLQRALTGWAARAVGEQKLNASVDGKWAKQSEDAGGNPLMMEIDRLYGRAS